MKRTNLYIVCLLLAVSFAGCQLGDGEMQKTRQGKQMFDNWAWDMQDFLHKALEPTVNFSSWLSAPESEKPQILEQFFESNTTVATLDSNEWILENAFYSEQLRFKLVNGTSLSDVNGAILVTTRKHTQDSYHYQNYLITHTEDGTLEITSTELPINLYFHIDRSDMPKSLKGIPFTMEGTFTSLSPEEYHLPDDSACSTYQTAEILEPVQGIFDQKYQYSWPDYASDLCLSAGKLKFTVYNDESSGNSAVVTILNKEKISVEMSGTTQVWKQDR